MVDRGARGRTGTTVVAANEHNVGAGLNYACSNGTNAHLANQLHADAGTGVGVLQIVNQLGQVLDGVYIMMGRRRNQADAGGGATTFGNPRIYLAAGQLAALARLSALGNLNLDFVRIY